MNIEGIKTADQLPFPVPRQLADDIAALLAAMERDDMFVDDYFDEVQGSARLLGPRGARQLLYHGAGGTVPFVGNGSISHSLGQTT